MRDDAGNGDRSVLDLLLSYYKEKSLADGAVKTWWGKNPKLKAVHDRKIAALAAHFLEEVAGVGGMLDPLSDEAERHGLGGRRGLQPRDVGKHSAQLAALDAPGFSRRA